MPSLLLLLFFAVSAEYLRFQYCRRTERSKNDAQVVIKVRSKQVHYEVCLKKAGLTSTLAHLGAFSSLPPGIKFVRLFQGRKPLYFMKCVYY